MANTGGPNTGGPDEQHPPRPVRPPVLNAPGVVTGLIAVMIFVYLGLSFAPASVAGPLEFMGAVSPRRFLNPADGMWMAAGVLSLFTHALLHAGLVHIGLNSVWLLAFGAPVARLFEAAAGDPRRGAAAFLGFFFLSSAAGALVFIAAHPQDPTLLVGASGGVSGLFGALVRFIIRREGSRRVFLGLGEWPVIAWTGVFIGLNLSMGLLGALVSPDLAQIAWEAHIGGYLFGLLALPSAARFARGGPIP